MIYKLISKMTSKLTKNEILKICYLKNTYWKYGMKEQIDWFKKNVQNNDIHNLLFLDKKLVGYTALKKRIFFSIRNNSFLKGNYLLFDTLIIDRKYRKKKLSTLLMRFNNNIIFQNRKTSFLVCRSSQVNYYLKYNWKQMNAKRFNVYDHTFKKSGMVFNLRKLEDKFFTFFIHK